MSKRTGPWLDEDPSMRRRMINNAFVARRAHHKPIEIMDRIRRNMREGAEPTCMTLVGPPGVGKSALLSDYAQFHPRVETFGAGHITRSLPVLYVELQANLGLTDAADLAMVALMGPTAPQGTRVRKSLLLHQLQLQNVELMIFDEFQHVLERGADKTRAATRDWIKSLTKATKIPAVMAGMSVINDIVDGDPQLDPLTPYRFLIDRYRYDSEADKKRFRSFLRDLDSLLPFDEPALLHEPDRARRLHLASAGILRPFCNLLRDAASIAIEERSRCIRDRDFAHAFESIGGDSSCVDNPFGEFL